MREDGKSIIIITHKLNEIMAVADRVSVNDTIDDYVPTTRFFLQGSAILLYRLTLK